MKHLCDRNVFLAIAIGQHVHHPTAAAWFAHLPDSDSAHFCRAPRMSFLRLLTQQIAPAYVPLTHLEAWAAHDQMMSDDATGFEPEPMGLDSIWRQFSATRTASPKVWIDAYLAAFAITGSLRLATFDKDFRKYKAQGLDLLLLPQTATAGNNQFYQRLRPRFPRNSSPPRLGSAGSLPWWRDNTSPRLMRAKTSDDWRKPLQSWLSETQGNTTISKSYGSGNLIACRALPRSSSFKMRASSIPEIGY